MESKGLNLYGIGRIDLLIKGEKCNEQKDKIENSISDLERSKLHEPI